MKGVISRGFICSFKLGGFKSEVQHGSLFGQFMVLLLRVKSAL